MGGLQAFNLCVKNPKAIKHLVLNDIGAAIDTAGLKRIASYVGKGSGVMIEFWTELSELRKPILSCSCSSRHLRNARVASSSFLTLLGT
jgi:hypothetical protein